MNDAQWIQIRADGFWNIKCTESRKLKRSLEKPLRIAMEACRHLERKKLELSSDDVIDNYPGNADLTHSILHRDNQTILQFCGEYDKFHAYVSSGGRSNHSGASQCGASAWNEALLYMLRI